MPTAFDVYGYRFTLRSTVAEAVEGIRQDFAFFAAEGPDEGVIIEMIGEEPPLEDLPPSVAVVYTPRNVAYRNGHTRYIDYHGRALGVHDLVTGNFKIFSRDLNLLYEATSLYLLSQIGKRLDSRGLHRIHALGFAVMRQAILVLLPMGGGKSTLALHLLEYPEIQLLSDDAPFIERNGGLLAYPLGLGLLPGSEERIPPQHRRQIQRMEFGAKHVVNYSYFQGRVCASAEPGIVLIGARTLSAQCRIEPAGIVTGMRACIARCIVGIGLFQGVEFILQSSPWELLKKAGLGISRFRNCWKLLRRSQIYHVHLGRDAKLNARTVRDFAVKHAQSAGESPGSVPSRISLSPPRRQP